MSIRKHTQNVIIDVISFILLLMLLLTGFIIHFILPAGSHGKSLWGFTRHEWGEMHFWIAILFVATIFYHLVLHFPWIKASIFTKKKKSQVTKL